MSKIKVGYLPLYIKLYDDDDPELRHPLVAYMQTLIKMLETQGLEVIQADEVCRIRPEFEKAAKKFNDAGVSAVITHHLAYSPSLESIDALLSLKAPIVVFDTTPDYELIEAAGYSERTDPNHGIHGVQDMCCMLKKNDRPYYMCVGHAMHSDVVARVAGMCRAAEAAAFFRSCTVGSVGGAFVGMGDFVVSDDRYRGDIGSQVKYMTPEDTAKYLAQVTEEEIDAEIASDRSKYDVRVTWEKEYREETRSGLAVRKWMEAEKVDSCTVNFLTLDQYGMPKMPFVECCKMMERRQGFAGEGDTLTAGLVGTMLHVYPNSTFVEMFCPDWKENVILLSHMGESNPNLSQWKPCVDNKPFVHNSCGNTVAMHNCYRPGKAVLVNLAPMKDHFNLVITPVEMLSVGLPFGAYMHSTQGWMKPHMPIDEFLEAYSMAGGTHHSAMVYDVDIREIRTFGKMMKFNVIEI